MTIEVVEALDPAVREGCLALRERVFIVEQRVPAELERDELDAVAVHAAALAGGRVVGTGRLVRQPAPGGEIGRVGRMAVDAAWRRAGVGARLLVFLEERARAMGLPEIELHAQCYVEPFYRRHGYAPEGATFEEAGIDHVVMRKRL